MSGKRVSAREEQKLAHHEQLLSSNYGRDGRRAAKLRRHHFYIENGDMFPVVLPFLLALLGFIILSRLGGVAGITLGSMLSFFLMKKYKHRWEHPELYMDKLDRQLDMAEDLEEALSERRKIDKVPGNAAKLRRDELDQSIENIRGLPWMLRDQAGDMHIELKSRDYDELQARIHRRLDDYQAIHLEEIERQRQQVELPKPEDDEPIFGLPGNPDPCHPSYP